MTTAADSQYAFNLTFVEKINWFGGKKTVKWVKGFTVGDVCSRDDLDVDKLLAAWFLSEEVLETKHADCGTRPSVLVCQMCTQCMQ